MYRHLNRFTSRTGATNTHTKTQRKENLPFAAGEPSPALSSSARAGPLQAACGASRPRLPPTGRAGPRAREQARRKGARVSFADQPSRGEHMGEAKRREPRGRGRASRVSVLFGAGLCPSLRPVSGSTSLLEASQKGAFPTPDSVTPPVHQSGASRPTPPLSHSSEKTGQQKSARLS